MPNPPLKRTATGYAAWPFLGQPVMMAACRGMEMSDRRKLVIALGASPFVTPSWSLAQVPV
jgi:hypothetical protein